MDNTVWPQNEGDMNQYIGGPKPCVAQFSPFLVRNGLFSHQGSLPYIAPWYIEEEGLVSYPVFHYPKESQSGVSERLGI